MSDVTVAWLSYSEDVPATGYWDHGMLHDLLEGKMWGASEFTHLQPSRGEDWTAGLDGAIVVFPARSQLEYVGRLQADLAKLGWVVLIITGDEDNSFPREHLVHPNMTTWVMSPRPDKHGDEIQKLGSGYPPHARELLRQSEHLVRPYDWSFAGQVTHERRQQAAKRMHGFLTRPGMENGRVVPTHRFIDPDGLSPGDYYALMANSRTVICPSGPETPDTFRVFEALEAGCVPVVDGRSPRPDWDGSWQWWTYLFDEEPPFPVFSNYDQLLGYTESAFQSGLPLRNKVFAWWIGYKRKLYYRLLASVPNCQEGKITVLISSSPVPSHPSTEMIEKTVADIRAVLPTAEIIIMCDGVRPEQQDRREAYEQYKERLLWLCNFEWHSVLPVIYEEHLHQSEMTRRTLSMVKTPLMLFVEHDAPLCPDFDYEWDDLAAAILDGEASVIRFYHEAQILSEHEHLMLGEPRSVHGVRMRPTAQWSQRPHLTSAVFYRWLLDTYIHADSRTMIEDELHGPVQDACASGMLGWYQFRLWVYTPEGDNIKRSYHLDGRGRDPKFDMHVVPIR